MYHVVYIFFVKADFISNIVCLPMFTRMYRTFFDNKIFSMCMLYMCVCVRAREDVYTFIFF